ncbi:MAG: phospho-sugar mutase, partial [Clostridia bacterium]|nr:phospho-sugar mutase [Clostridia bacterium]
SRVVEVRDYLGGTVTDLVTGEVSSTGFDPSDVLYYVLECGDKVIVRPSGTEPKIKIYVLCHDTDERALDEKLENYRADAKKIGEI